MRSHALNAPGLRREDELAIRCAMAEAWLLRDDITQAATVLGRPPDLTRERIPPGQLSARRLHGRLAALRGDQSRAIALLGRALKQAELALDSRAIGLAHYALGVCHRQVGDPAIVREEVTKAIPALNAAGDCRHLALCHSLAGIVAAQSGQFDEAMASLRQAERLATAVRAEDVLAFVCGNQANVTLMRHRHDQALALAERALSLHEHAGSVHGLAVALASLGEILRPARRPLAGRAGADARARDPDAGAAARDVGRRRHARPDPSGARGVRRRRAVPAAGLRRVRHLWSRGQPLVRVVDPPAHRQAGAAPRHPRRRAAPRRGDRPPRRPRVPAADAIQAELLAAESLLADGAVEEAERRLSLAVAHLDPRATPGAWGDYLRLRAQLHLRRGRATDAYHDLAQSASVFDLLGERYQAALSRLALGRLVAEVGARSTAERYLREAITVFESLGAAPDLEEARSSARFRAPALDDGRGT